jgi:hypothetical protein
MLPRDAFTSESRCLLVSVNPRWEYLNTPENCQSDTLLILQSPINLLLSSLLLLLLVTVAFALPGSDTIPRNFTASPSLTMPMLNGKPNPTFIGAIDQGTTSSRFLIFDTSGDVVATHQLEFKQYYPHPG